MSDGCPQNIAIPISIGQKWNLTANPRICRTANTLERVGAPRSRRKFDRRSGLTSNSWFPPKSMSDRRKSMSDSRQSHCPLAGRKVHFVSSSPSTGRVDSADVASARIEIFYGKHLTASNLCPTISSDRSKDIFRQRLDSIQ